MGRPTMTTVNHGKDLSVTPVNHDEDLRVIQLWPTDLCIDFFAENYKKIRGSLLYPFGTYSGRSNNGHILLMWGCDQFPCVVLRDSLGDDSNGSYLQERNIHHVISYII